MLLYKGSLLKLQGRYELYLNAITRTCTSSWNEKTRADLLTKGLPKRKPINGVKRILLVASGKGGVGKSTVAVNVAVAMKKLEPHKEVGLLDADVFGPSVPLMMNLHESPIITDDNYIKPLLNYGVKCMSMGNLITETSAVIWRGLMVMSALNKLLRQVAWGPLDYMIIDTPPGTGDTHLSLVQNIPIAGTIIVSTGQKASLQVTKRGITMFEKLHIPVLGIVHNMSSIRCSNCLKNTTIFGNDIQNFSERNNMEILGNIPLDPLITEDCDSGKPVVLSRDDSPQAQEFLNIARKLATFFKSQDIEEV